MQAAGNLIAAVTEFAAGMQNSHNNLNGRFAYLMHINRYSAPVIADGNTVVFMYFYFNQRTITGQSLVDTVIDNLIHQMVQAPAGNAADIHTRAFAHSFQAF